MAVIIFRIGIGLIFFIVLIANTIYPAFRDDLPLFWMFRGRKARQKYKEHLEKVKELEAEKHVIRELEERTNKLQKRG